MKSHLLIFVCFMVCVFDGGLFAQANEANTEKKPEDLLKTTWTLVSITTDKGEAPLPDQHGITLVIDEKGRITGKSGVNQYFGSFSIVKGKINPFFPALRSGHRLFHRPSPGKQFPSN